MILPKISCKAKLSMFLNSICQLSQPNHEIVLHICCLSMTPFKFPFKKKSIRWMIIIQKICANVYHTAYRNILKISLHYFSNIYYWFCQLIYDLVLQHPHSRGIMPHVKLLVQLYSQDQSFLTTFANVKRFDLFAWNFVQPLK